MSVGVTFVFTPQKDRSFDRSCGHLPGPNKDSKRFTGVSRQWTSSYCLPLVSCKTFENVYYVFD